MRATREALAATRVHGSGIPLGGLALPSMRFEVVFLALASAACTPPPIVDAPQLPPSPAVLQVSGMDLVGGLGFPVKLRGISFTNRVWQDDLLPDEHHDDTDYDRLRDLGMNAVRFYVNARALLEEDVPDADEAPIWRWLEDNVAWARARGVYLIVDLYVPPNQPMAPDQFVELWRMVAERFRGEPVIAGYAVTVLRAASTDQGAWQALAGRTAAAIRAVDPEHALFVSLGGGERDALAWTPFLIEDSNVVYDFRFFEPFDFTHQSAPWEVAAPVDQEYPDVTKVEAPPSLLNRAAGTDGSPRLPAGDSDWTYYEGAAFQVTDPAIVVGSPTLVCSHNYGKASFDDLVLERVNADGLAEPLQRITLDTLAGWHFSSEDDSGLPAVERGGHRGGALSIAGTRDEAHLSAPVWRFRTQPNATYRLSGWMKGEAIEPGAQCQIRLDFFHASSALPARDRDLLAAHLEPYFAWAKEHQVPLFCEFGTIRDSFVHDRGGERWTADMLDLLIGRGLDFAYLDYHEDFFGLFAGDGSLPDPAYLNEALADTLRAKLLVDEPPENQ